MHPRGRMLRCVGHVEKLACAKHDRNDRDSATLLCRIPHCAFHRMPGRVGDHPCVCPVDRTAFGMDKTADHCKVSNDRLAVFAVLCCYYWPNV